MIFSNFERSPLKSGKISSAAVLISFKGSTFGGGVWSLGASSGPKNPVRRRIRRTISVITTMPPVTIAAITGLEMFILHKGKKGRRV